MKKPYCVVFVLLFVLNAWSQEPEPPVLLEAEEGWTKEVFQFPIGFAPELSYVGYEEARFPKGWGDQESTQFWSYVFAWHIEASAALTTQTLARDLQLYFDGLMQAVNKEKGKQIPPTTTVLSLTEIKDDSSKFNGTVHTHDSFRSKAMMTLQVQVEQHFCKITQQALVVFRFSPQPFDSAIWLELKQIKPKHSICE